MTGLASSAIWRMSTLVRAPEWWVQTSRISDGHWITRIVGPTVEADAYRYGSYSAEGAAMTHRYTVRIAGSLCESFVRAGQSVAD